MPETQTRDLVCEVTSILRNLGHPNPSFWENQIPEDAKHYPEESVRRFLINQYWREQLGAIDLRGEGNTIGDRFCLIEDGSIEDWLRLFREKVAKSVLWYRIGF